MTNVKRLKEEIAILIEEGKSDRQISEMMGMPLSMAKTFIKVVEKELYDQDDQYVYPFGRYEELEERIKIYARVKIK